MYLKYSKYLLVANSCCLLMRVVGSIMLVSFPYSSRIWFQVAASSCFAPSVRACRVQLFRASTLPTAERNMMVSGAVLVLLCLCG